MGIVKYLVTEVLVLQFPRRAAWQDESEDVQAAAPGSVLASKA